MKVVHNWLKDYIGDSIPTAQEIETLLTFHAFEVEGVEAVAGHEVIDIKILPDRGADCLSHRGIARELASIIGVPLVFDPLQNNERLAQFSDITVSIVDPKACTRFSAALVTGIAVGSSPLWLQKRLLALGQRPINNIVDATNYVMYSLGQPIHAYDADKFPQKEGKWQFEVRFAEVGESVSLIAEGGKHKVNAEGRESTLGYKVNAEGTEGALGQEDRVITLQGTELLIVDGSSGRPIGLAGVKGGAYAGVDSATSKIIIEAAHFDPVVVRKTARRLGIVIDASKRFENNLSEGLVPHALRDVVKLIIEIAGGKCEGAIDVTVGDLFKRNPVTLPIAQVNALLGLSLSKEVMIDLVKKVGATIVDQGDTLLLEAPFERMDLNIPEDYIEEIGRLYGYINVASQVPPIVPLVEMNMRHFYSDIARVQLFSLGFSEVITSSFREKDAIQLQNALANDKSYLRSNLAINLREVLQKNANLVDILGAQDTRVFEIGTVFTRFEGVIHEHVSLCIGVQVKVKGYTPKDDELLKTIVTSLEEKLGTSLNGTVEQGVFECNWSNVFTQLPVPIAYEKVPVAKEIIYKPFSLYPAIARDIALWVTEGTDTETVQTVIDANAGALRVRTTLLDVFTKEGRTSYAFRLVFQSYEKTFTDEEANACMKPVYAAVQEKGWEVR